MPTYAIGDIQGCFEPLQRLLEKIQFDPAQDTLWFTGDIVNRGPASLATLRFIKQLKNKIVVLGNHDLHLLAVAHGAHVGWPDDTLQDILTAPDRDELLAWLQQQPILHFDKYLLVHAGLAPSWDLLTAQKLAREVETALQDNAKEFFHHMYGNQPNQWHEDLTGWNRLRCITNYFTRARFCYADGSLELHKKGKTAEKLFPWFQLPERASRDIPILFGHWAALGGETHTANTFALDTGCVWKHCLTAMRLEDQQRIFVTC